MNKRIKNKVTKRVINKIKNENSLTKFEEIFFYKYLCEPFSNIVMEIRESIKAAVEIRFKEHVKDIRETAMRIEERETREKLELHETTVGGFTYSSKAFSSEDQLKSAVDAMNSFGKQINPEASVETVEEPNKWNKLKGKVKGWFGK